MGAWRKKEVAKGGSSCTLIFINLAMHFQQLHHQKLHQQDKQAVMQLTNLQQLKHTCNLTS